jgi:Ca-activated chloride channel family protein
VTSLLGRTVAAAIVMTAVGVCAKAQGPEREVIILSPGPESVLRGKVALSADVRPADLEASQVVFFVDGDRVCAVPARPYHCEFDAGAGLTPRDVWVVAELRGGGRLTKSVRTSALPTATFRGAVDLVSVSVHVRDRSGRPVNGLGPESFRAFEDNQPQSIVSLATEDVPADLILALDTSGSMTPALGELKSAALGFLRALRPIDRPRVASFSTALSQLTPASATPQQRQEAIQRLTAGGGTALYDAIIEAAEELRNARGRRAVIVFTDGDDVSSYGSIPSVRTALQTNDVVLYIIAQGKAAADARLRRDLSTLASETGGLSFFAPKMSTLSEHFSEILSDLSTEYVVGYSPQLRVGDGAWRKIKVEVGRPEDRYRVRAREGYLAIARSSGR